MKTRRVGAEQVTPNLYGNLVANVVAGLTGGPGILPGVNVGDQCAVFEQVRQSRELSMHKAGQKGFVYAGACGGWHQVAEW